MLLTWVLISFPYLITMNQLDKDDQDIETILILTAIQTNK